MPLAEHAGEGDTAVTDQEAVGTHQTLRERDLDDGLAAAISALPWVRQLCPLMPHEYAVHSRSPAWEWETLEARVMPGNPASYLVCPPFRGVG
jgi:hypothetical protein